MRKNSGALIGIIDIIPPSVSREHYRLEQYPFFIEFYLAGNAKGKAIMTKLLPEIIAELRFQGIEHRAVW
jgi:ribosomal-protein-alanine N-acetyltransferase